MSGTEGEESAVDVLFPAHPRSYSVSFLSEVLASRGHREPYLEHFDSGTTFIACSRQKGLSHFAFCFFHTKEMRLRESK